MAREAVTPKEIMPNDPEMKKLSKKEHIEKMNAFREKKVYLKEKEAEFETAKKVEKASKKK